MIENRKQYWVTMQSAASFGLAIEAEPDPEFTLPPMLQAAKQKAAISVLNDLLEELREYMRKDPEVLGPLEDRVCPHIQAIVRDSNGAVCGACGVRL